MSMTIEEKQARLDARKEARQQAKEQARIDAERNQKPVKEITITIEWKKSRTWGSNPHADARVIYHNGDYAHMESTASGCGYDKESQVISDIFNAFLRYKLWRELPVDKKYWINQEKEAHPYGVTVTGDHRYYAGGIGTSCYYAISKYIGGKFDRIASGKTFDVYTYTDGQEA